MRVASVKIHNPDASGTSVLINASDKQDHHELWPDQIWAWQSDGDGGLAQVLPGDVAKKVDAPVLEVAVVVKQDVKAPDQHVLSKKLDYKPYHKYESKK